MSEVWKDIVGFEGLYQVSNRGRVKSCARTVPHPHGDLTISERLLRPGGRPYQSVVLSKGGRGQQRSFRLHILVLTTFVGPAPKGLEARHLNDNPDDNRWPENLVWGTHGQNVDDLIRNGGTQRRNTKLDLDDVRKIRRLLSHCTQQQISQKYGVSASTISMIKRGEIWIDA